MILDKFSLAGQVGIVTGGGQGLGKVFCHAFAEAAPALGDVGPPAEPRGHETGVPALEADLLLFRAAVEPSVRPAEDMPRHLGLRLRGRARPQSGDQPRLRAAGLGVAREDDQTFGSAGRQGVRPQDSGIRNGNGEGRIRRFLR